MLKAAGFLVFRRCCSDLEYLLMKTSYGTKHWSPPKGHCDPGEDDLQTAYRETEEEAGLKQCNLQVFMDQKYTLKYKVKGRDKQVIYWLAELLSPEHPIVLSPEHTEYKWLKLEQAKKYAEYEDIMELFDNAECYIRNQTQDNKAVK